MVEGLLASLAILRGVELNLKVSTAVRFFFFMPIPRLERKLSPRYRHKKSRTGVLLTFDLGRLGCRFFAPFS